MHKNEPNNKIMHGLIEYFKTRCLDWHSGQVTIMFLYLSRDSAKESGASLSAQLFYFDCGGQVNNLNLGIDIHIRTFTKILYQLPSCQYSNWHGIGTSCWGWTGEWWYRWHHVPVITPMLSLILSSIIITTFISIQVLEFGQSTEFSNVSHHIAYQVFWQHVCALHDTSSYSYWLKTNIAQSYSRYTIEQFWCLRNNVIKTYIILIK